MAAQLSTVGVMKPKKTIASRYRREEQAKTGRHELHYSIAPRSNNTSRVDARKNRKREVPALIRGNIAYKTIVDNLIKENSQYEKELSEQQVNYASLKSSLESKEKEMNELKQLNNELQLKFNVCREMFNNLSNTSDKKIKSLHKVNERYSRKISLLKSKIQKSTLQNEEKEKTLQQARETCKRTFHSAIQPNFLQTHSSLINEIVKLYEYNSHSDKIQHCPAIEYVHSSPEATLSRWHSENNISTDLPTKKRKLNIPVEDIDKHYSQSSLKILVMNLEQRHSEKYVLWRNVLWSLNRYGRERGYDTLEIADSFSQRSSKYKNLEDVKQTFEASDGSLSLQYLIEMSKIYEENLEMMTAYLIAILPSAYSKFIITQVDIRDRRKFRLNVTSAGKSKTLFIIPDLCVVTDENNARLCFLQKEIRSKNKRLVALYPAMQKGFVVTFKEDYYEFKAINQPLVVLKLFFPLNPAETFIILPNGKQDDNKSHLAKIRKALREVAIKLLSAQSEKKFGDDEDDNTIVGVPDEDPDKIRTDLQLVKALCDADPSTKERYKYSGKIIYYCDAQTNLWCELGQNELDNHLRRKFTKAVQLTKAEQKYINKSNAIYKLRQEILRMIEDIGFTHSLNSKLKLFFTENKTIDTSYIPPIIRNVEPGDLAKTTCQWSYSYELSMKYADSVQSYFDKLIPRRCEQEWFLSFVAKLLSGQKINEYFLVLTGKRESKNGISTLISLLATVFDIYYIAINKMGIAGKIREIDQYDGGISNLQEKRLLVSYKLHKADTLNCDFIKAITSPSHYYMYDKKKYFRTQFKFPVQAGLIITFNDDDVPKFDKTDQDFVDKMATLPMQSRFMSQEEIKELTANKRNITDIHSADDSLKSQFPEWRSAVLDLLIKHYKESLPAIPDSMMNHKKKLCDENFDYNDWLDSHICKDENSFVAAAEIMRLINKSQEFHPIFMQRLKSAMSLWAEKNDYSYKARHVYYVTKSKRAETRSVILKAALCNINMK